MLWTKANVTKTRNKSNASFEALQYRHDLFAIAHYHNRKKSNATEMIAHISVKDDLVGLLSMISHQRRRTHYLLTVTWVTNNFPAVQLFVDCVHCSHTRQYCVFMNMCFLQILKLKLKLEFISELNKN